MKKELKITPLYNWHRSQEANMAEFGQYEMPLWYPSGIKNEHRSVLLNSGIFDTTHMASIMIKGADAEDLLQKTFSRDLRACVGEERKPLWVGKCVYGVFLNEKGEVIDDAIVYAMPENTYLLVVNSGMGKEIAQHLSQHRDDRSVQVNDLTSEVGKIDLQGPVAAKILMKTLVDAGETLKGMSYFSFKGSWGEFQSTGENVQFIEGIPILLSRTGYTGEFGFEIFTDSNQVQTVWEILVEVGRDFGLLPCGLAARDSLRASAMLPLSHQDIGAWPFVNNPWTFALPLDQNGTGFTKEFIGGKALEKENTQEYTFPFVGSDLRKITPGDDSIVINPSGLEIGTALTCVTDMGIGYHEDKIYSVSSPDKPDDFNPRGLCCGFVKVSERLNPEQIVELRDDRRKIKVTIVEDVRPDRTARYPMEKMIGGSSPN